MERVAFKYLVLWVQSPTSSPTPRELVLSTFLENLHILNSFIKLCFYYNISFPVSVFHSVPHKTNQMGAQLMFHTLLWSCFPSDSCSANKSDPEHTHPHTHTHMQRCWYLQTTSLYADSLKTCFTKSLSREQRSAQPRTQSSSPTRPQMQHINA